jgi:hypothetical protein
VAARDKLKTHRKHLEKPPDEFLKEKLALFGMTPEDLEAIPPVLINDKRRRAVVIHAEKGAKPKVIDHSKHTKTVTPKSLDELKELAGVPQRVFEKQPELVETALKREVDAGRIRKLRGRPKLGDLEPDDQKAVFDEAFNYLMGPVDRPSKFVVTAMLQLAQKLALFIATDLIVNDGQSVTFANYGALYFNNVLVYGSGSINLGDNTKLHAYSVKHV